MGGWIHSDATGVTLHFPPLPEPPQILVIMGLAGAVLFMLLALLNAWPRDAQATKRLARRWSGMGIFFGRHYVALVFLGVAIVCIWAAAIGLWRVPSQVDGLLTQLQNKNNTAETTRSIITALAAVLAAIAIFGTIIVQSIRVWINERTARTSEANLLTGLINTAVEGLGTEKRVSRIGRPVRLVPRAPSDAETRTVIEWRKEDKREGEDLPRDEAFTREPGDWQTFEFTAPNLEVRIGAILTLERISREYPGEHIRVMDILCAYIRENAPGGDARDHGLGEWPEYPVNPKGLRVEPREKQISERRSVLKSWIDSLPSPRTDVQVAIEVIGRRRDERKEVEKAAETRGRDPRYRLDLRNTNLRRYDFSHLDFGRALFVGARLEGAHLGGARLEGTHLGGARMEGAHLGGARLEGAYLGGARLEGADLVGARMEGAYLVGARLEGADLVEARLEGAYLNWARLARAYLGGARLEGADLRGARLEGAYLNWADFRRSNWAGASNQSSPAQFSDLRGAQGLTQAQLENLIGNEGTLLPDHPAPDTGEPFYVWSCWDKPPPDIDEIVATAAGPSAGDDERTALRAEFICGPGNPRRKTGTPLPVDAPYPEGHPLAEGASEA